MQTYNVNVTREWVKVVTGNTGGFLLSFRGLAEVAITSADAVPSVMGNLFDSSMGLDRLSIGTGYVWARAHTVDRVVAVVIE